jgi:hypothetical protein|tara:strand:+ start:76 stop:282 length:207 start_codon:yes stop_codon:yes gene_type:complete
MSNKIEEQLLEERKIKALEKIANSVDALTLWFEEVDKEEWGERIAWYLDLWKQKYIDEETGDNSSIQE